MYEVLYTELRHLRDTTASGFEGFVKALLDGFAPGLGIAFLSKSGYQGGVDASSAGFRTTWAALECKHYDCGSCPRALELVGGLELAISNSREQLDLWLLVTTGAVGANEAKELRFAGERAGCAVEIIDWQLAGLPILAVLCAANSDLVLSELEQRLPSLDEPAVKSDLESIAAHEAFEEHRRQLAERLTSAHLGYSRASDAANGWIAGCLGSRQNAFARLNQYLCPGDTGFSAFIERSAVGQGLDTWLSHWRTGNPLMIAIGREGVGKSWAVMDWWRNLPERPITLLITSNINLPSADPIALMAQLLYLQTSASSQEFWEKAIRRWLRRPAPDAPIVLIIFDGINERPADSWISRLAGFRDEALKSQVALLVTCWKSYWEERLESRMPDVLPYDLVQVEPFNDAELRQALEQNNIAFDALRPDVREFLRVPRIFRAAIGHLSRLIETNDLTIERLLVSDAQFRLRDRSGISLTERQFNDLVVGLARDFQNGISEFSHGRMRELTKLGRPSSDENLERNFDEIVAGNLFERLDTDGTAFRVRPQFACLALGMVLADEVRTAARNGQDAILQAIGTSLDSYSDLSQTSSVIHGAVACACLWSNFPQEAVEELLLAWLRQRNRLEAHHHDFAAYLPDQPTAYLNVAERVWTNFSEFPDGRRWIIDALRHHLHQSAPFDVIRSRAIRWLSLWHRDWHPFLGRADQERLGLHRSAIDQRWASATASERQLISDYLIEANYAEEPFLADLAFLIASLVDRLPFSKGFAAWALSRTLMQLPVDFDRAAWCLRLTRTDPDELERALLVEAQGFDKAGGALAKKAGDLLLRALATPRATAHLPSETPQWTRSPIRQMSIDALDPAAIQPALDEPLKLLSRIDTAAIHTHMGRGEADSQYELVEPVLAAFAPRDLVSFVRRVMLTAPGRAFTPLRQLALFAVTHAQVVGREEREALEAAREAIIHGTTAEAETDRWFVESELFLALLPGYDAKEQYERLVHRPLDAKLLLNMEPIFDTLSPDGCNVRLEALQRENELSVLRAALWFLSTQRFDLTATARGVLVLLLEHGDAIVRSLALRLAIGCRDAEALSKHFKSGWQFSDESSDDFVNFYGTMALGAREGEVRYDELRGRAHPGFLGWIAIKDGSQDAIGAFAEDLDAIWQVLSVTDVADKSMDEGVTVSARRKYGSAPERDYLTSSSFRRAVYRANVGLSPADRTENIRDALMAMSDPNAFERREARAQERMSALIERAKKQGVQMFGHRFRREGLREVVQQRPDLVQKWTAALDELEGQHLIWRAGDFYRALAGAIARDDPRRATEIIQRLRSAGGMASRTIYEPLGIEAALFEGFSVVDEPYASNLRDNWLDEAVTDEDLFQLALIAQDTGNQDWLSNVVERDAGANVLAVQARALTLVGFLDEGVQLTRLRSLLSGQQGYLAEVADVAIARLERNRRARYWFREFLTRADNELSWAAMRLAVRCMDRRYFLWSDKLIESVEAAPSLRRRVLVALRNDISNAISGNETNHTHKLEDTLFGTKILKGELHPWLD